MTGLILLAAGQSARMGQPKQLLPFQGRPLIRHACEVALASTCRPVVVVIGERAAQMRTALAGLPVEICENVNWAQGIGSSIHAGVQIADTGNWDALVLALADQPMIRPEIYDELVKRHAPVVASQYAGTVGVPALFTRCMFPALLALDPNQGCKSVILANRQTAVLVDCPEAEVDVDTPEDYQRLRS